MTSWTILLILIGVGVVDLYLVLTKRKTITQGWLLDRLGIRWNPDKRTKHIILISLLVATWALFGGVDTFVRVLIGVIMGHLLWDR